MGDTNCLPADHAERMKRARLSFDGLSIGDGFGECFFTSGELIEKWQNEREPPPSPWFVTDDTMMAASIVRCLDRHGTVEQDLLAKLFAAEFVREPMRGYGGGAVNILTAISRGVSWKRAGRMVFDGQGSCGNGGAMRVAPIGAYFAEDYERVAYEAKLSAEVTHAHPDGQTGAMAVALATAWMVTEGEPKAAADHRLIEFVLERLPQTDTFNTLKKALKVPFEMPPPAAARLLGNGSNVISSDTVPFCLWCAARHQGNFTDALWCTVSGLGDRDTTCAIVGGIVSASAGRDGLPGEWLNAREIVRV
jgi:ADP-ribosylglycohydrolase